MNKTDIRKEKQKLRPDDQLVELLKGLRAFVDLFNRNPKLAFRDGIYTGLDPNKVYSVQSDGVTIGYKLTDRGLTVRRTVFAKCEQPWESVPMEDRERIFSSILQACFDRGESVPNITEEDPFLTKIEQDFMPVYMFEKNPNIVTPGRKG